MPNLSIPPCFISSRCELCGVVGNLSSCICDACIDDLPQVINQCVRCGMVLSKNAEVCGSCLNTDWLAYQTICPFQYHYPLDRLIQKIKYHDGIRLISPLANKLALKLDQQHLPEVMIPVPLHPFRAYNRGFNQSMEICRILKNQLGIQIFSDGILRTRNTKPMFDLGSSQRSINIRGAFRLTKSLSHRSVAIVDDVITSGATANELARILIKAGANKIAFWALARS